jgi:AcrR family transcriptional regulator
MSPRRYDRDATRDDLLRQARQMFSTAGYAATSTEELVAAVGLTRGALYHHFGNKQGLFEAVLEQVQLELAAEVNRRGRAARGGPLDSLRAGFHAYLDVSLREDVRRILLIDGPAVMGWDAWHELDLRHAYGTTRLVLGRAIDAGELRAAPLDELTHVLLGAVTQAALEVGRADNVRTARRRLGKVLDLLLDGLTPR